YDLARADAERALANLGVQRALNELNEHSATLAALVDAPGWRPQPAVALSQVVAQFGDAEADVAGNPALRVARDETAAAQARVEPTLARAELLGAIAETQLELRALSGSL